MKPVCKISHCSRDVAIKKSQLCARHYHIEWSGKSPENYVLERIEPVTCELDKCGKPSAKLSLCSSHYSQARSGLLESHLHIANPYCQFPECKHRASRKTGTRCRRHIEEGERPLGKNQSRDGTCVFDACGGAIYAKKMCSSHYQADYTAKNPYKKAERVYCLHEGCEVSVGSLRVRCGKHARQFDAYGITWSGRWPTPEQLPYCAVSGCERKARSVKISICNRHNSRRGARGMTIDAFIALLEPLRCESCGDAGNADSLVIDHDHSCCPGERSCASCVRGLLCNGCNSALGMLRDSRSRAEALAAYAGRVALP